MGIGNGHEHNPYTYSLAYFFVVALCTHIYDLTEKIGENDFAVSSFLTHFAAESRHCEHVDTIMFDLLTEFARSTITDHGVLFSK